MTIYTKKGDRGETFLLNGKKVTKDSLIIEAFGSIDELSSYIGYVNSYLKNKEDKKNLINIQRHLYTIMSYISGAKTDVHSLVGEVKKIEQYIDKWSLLLPNLNRFILPSGTREACLFHTLRTTTRRCERKVVSYFKIAKKNKRKGENIILQYLNRLSDMFFMIARKYSKNKEIVT